MKPRHLLLISLASLAALTGCASPLSQAPGVPPQEETWVAPEPRGAVEGEELSPAQLDELLGPIALYPDAIVALVLPAATDPSEIVVAARFVARGGREVEAERQPWSESVRTLVRYPAVLQWLDERLDWTRRLGLAFLRQPDAVMEGIQRLRRMARTAGTLEDTAEQRVIVEEEVVRIVPVRMDVVYIPIYDYRLIYCPPRSYRHHGPWIQFRVHYPMGSWLVYDCAWRWRRVWVYRDHDHWRRWHWCADTRDRYREDGDRHHRDDRRDRGPREDRGEHRPEGGRRPVAGGELDLAVGDEGRAWAPSPDNRHPAAGWRPGPRALPRPAADERRPVAASAPPPVARRDAAPVSKNPTRPAPPSSEQQTPPPERRTPEAARGDHPQSPEKKPEQERIIRGRPGAPRPSWTHKEDGDKPPPPARPAEARPAPKPPPPPPPPPAPAARSTAPERPAPEARAPEPQPRRVEPKAPSRFAPAPRPPPSKAKPAAPQPERRPEAKPADPQPERGKEAEAPARSERPEPERRAGRERRTDEKRQRD